MSCLGSLRFKKYNWIFRRDIHARCTHTRIYFFIRHTLHTAISRRALVSMYAVRFIAYCAYINPGASCTSMRSTRTTWTITAIILDSFFFFYVHNIMYEKFLFESVRTTHAAPCTRQFFADPLGSVIMCNNFSHISTCS